jgi:7-cyano-7-deazaguanine synthase in queuosine biosynthesis
MRLICGPTLTHPPADEGLRVVLYGQPGADDRGSAGAATLSEIVRRRLDPSPRAWDLLSIALSAVTADFAGQRGGSPDGWTREFELQVAVADPDFWNDQAEAVAQALEFLTTDRWHLHFHPGGLLPSSPNQPVRPIEDSVVLLSGGMDSLIGAIDLVAAGRRPLAVSQIVRGDAFKQLDFATKIGGGLNHLQLNHNAHAPGAEEGSQRARSLIFLAFGVLAATALGCYHEGDMVPLYVCENGFIAVNPPLTGARIGSLSTRTAHPGFFSRLQQILDAADLRVKIENPYQFVTKGEMLSRCADQSLLQRDAAISTSCGRFQRYNYRHCGRCVPCQVRRAAFLTWGLPDATDYVFEALGRDDSDHAGFDDVRAVAMAIAQVKQDSFDAWSRPALGSLAGADVASFKDLIRRGLAELEALHHTYRVK